MLAANVKTVSPTHLDPALSSPIHGSPCPPILHTVSSLPLYSLLHPSYPLLPLMAARFPFETAIGVNGQVWIRAGSISQTVALGRAIKEVDEGRVEAESIGEWVDKLDGVLAE